MKKIGLTGSIGMGKTTVSAIFKKYGIPVYSADEAVHALYKNPSVVALIEKAFPYSIKEGMVDRQVLTRYFVDNPNNIDRLNKIIHPLVRNCEDEFLELARMRGEKMVVLDVPLLFETKSHERMDVVIVVSAPFAVQKERVLARPFMNEDKFKIILSQQMDDEEKRKRADFVVDTAGDLGYTEKQVKEWLRDNL